MKFIQFARNEGLKIEMVNGVAPFLKGTKTADVGDLAATIP
jgi:hypothetical protein